jgi:acetate kinase
MPQSYRHENFHDSFSSDIWVIPADEELEIAREVADL